MDDIPNSMKISTVQKFINSKNEKEIDEVVINITSSKNKEYLLTLKKMTNEILKDIKNNPNKSKAVGIKEKEILFMKKLNEALNKIDIIQEFIMKKIKKKDFGLKRKG